MNIVVPLTLKFNSPYDTANFPVHVFFETHQNALSRAAQLLGGNDGAKLVNMISDALSQEFVPSRRTTHLLSELMNLLLLKQVDDQDRPEADYFASIDPKDPVVEEICLLADGLAEVLHSASTAFARCSQDSASAQQTAELS